LILGVTGAMRVQELTDFTVDNATKHGDVLLLHVPDTKTKVSRNFVIDQKLLPFIEKNTNLRPSNVQHRRFFVNFQKRKCTRQPIGKNKIASIPSEIAKFLKLPNPHLYTGTKNVYSLWIHVLEKLSDIRTRTNDPFFI